MIQGESVRCYPQPQRAARATEVPLQLSISVRAENSHASLSWVAPYNRDMSGICGRRDTISYCSFTVETKYSQPEKHLLWNANNRADLGGLGLHCEDRLPVTEVRLNQLVEEPHTRSPTVPPTHGHTGLSQAENTHEAVPGAWVLLSSTVGIQWHCRVCKAPAEKTATK